MRKPDAPCKDCPYRNAACHARCEKYKKYVEDNMAWLAEKHERIRHNSNVIAVERRRTKRVREAMKQK